MVSPESQRVLADLKTIMSTLGFPMMVVGAGARILVFDQVYGKTGRTTTDWDIAVSIANWQSFQSLRQALTQAPSSRFKITRTLHRFIHINTGIEVDVIPFGPIGEPDQQITWPDGMEMNLLGFDEALGLATSQKIAQIEMPIVGLSGWLVLKLIAWSDRKQSKDLQDIHFVLQHYENEQIFDLLAEELSSGSLEFEEAAIWLLGQDIRSSFAPTTIAACSACLTQILERQNNLLPQLIDSSLDNPDWDIAFEQAIQRFTIFRSSLDHATPAAD